MKVKRILIAVGVGCLSALGSSAALTADDYCSPSVTTPAGVKEMRPLNDGVSFAALSDDGRSDRKSVV